MTVNKVVVKNISMEDRHDDLGTKISDAPEVTQKAICLNLD